MLAVTAAATCWASEVSEQLAPVGVDAWWMEAPAWQMHAGLSEPAL